MARRVGFGDRSRREELAPEPEPTAPEAAPAATDDTPPKKGGPVARLFIILFLLAWLTLWSFGIYEAWDSFTDILAGFDWEAFDIVLLIFFAIWLGGALIGWAFGVVILFVMLFGKEKDPAEGAKRLKHWRERRRRTH